MNKKKAKLTFIFTTVMSFLGLIIAQTYMIYIISQKINDDDEDKFPGSIGLRKYFDSGDGSEESPYIITRPIHLYNLERLQSLGAFSSKFYFELGKDINGDGSTLFYTDNLGSDTSTYLDMSGTEIISIGSPSNPFFGDFEGNNMVIDNLVVNGTPEDIGVFGYIAPDASVEDVIFSNLTITDNGYSDSISDLFSTYDPSLNAQTNMTFNALGTINSTDTFDTYVYLDDFEGEYFIPSYPTTLDSDITFSIRSTNSYILKTEEQADGTDYLYVDTSALTDDTGDGGFAESGQSNKIEARIYLSANKTIDNIVYSKILATYTLVFHHTSDDEIFLNIAKDPAEDFYNYTHSTNVGLLAGHCDGSFYNSYVYNGHFDFNNDIDGYNPYPSETETGFIGESGINVNSTSSPESAYNDSGDTGIINFTAIYNNVRESQTTGYATGSKSAGSDTYNYVYFTPSEDSLYNEYLRQERINTTDLEPAYVTGENNNIDFKGQQVIQDDDENDRGLGIFQLNTADYDNETDYNNNFFYGLGEFNITYDYTNPLDEIYFTTAEFDATKDLSGNSVDPDDFFETYAASSSGITNWSPESNSQLFRLNNGTTFPYIVKNTTSFGGSTINNLLSSSRFEKNFNYIINFDLETSDTMNYKDYFADTDNLFLQDYFKYKLRDKYGDTIDPGEENFGVMLKDIDDGISTNITSFDSYLKISSNNGTISTMSIVETDEDGEETTVEYPSKTIEFTVEADYGANVTLVAKSTSDSSNYVCIYDKKYVDSGETDIGYYPSYSMYIPDYDYSDLTESGMSTYFEYSQSDDDITSISDVYDNPTLETSDGERLYAHTFFLPQGEYFLGTPEGNAYIYYIAAQGQEGKGNVSSENTVYTDNVIEDLDFLLYDPKQLDFDLDSNRAYLAFDGSFTSNLGSVDVTTDTDTSGNSYLVITAPLDSEDDGNLESLLIYNEKGYEFEFNGTTYTDTYVRYNYE